MGLNFYIGEVQAQANQASQMNNQASQAIASLQTSIQSFLSAPLSSKAYDSAKSYFMVAYTPLCQSAIMTGEALESANKRLLSDYQSMVCGIDTIEDEILEQIARFEEVKRDVEQQMSTAKTMRPDLERRYINACETIEKRQEKLRKFHEYNAHSATIFSDYESCEAEFSAGLNQVANCKAWNPATGTFDMTRLNMSWAKPINERWKARAKELENRVKAKRDNWGKQVKADGLKLQSELDKRKYMLVDINGTKRWMWVIDPTRITQEDFQVNEAYDLWIKNQIELYGRDAVFGKEEPDYLTKLAIELRDGKNYDTGKSLTDLEKAQRWATVASMIAAMGIAGYYAKHPLTAGQVTPKGKKASGANVPKLSTLTETEQLKLANQYKQTAPIGIPDSAKINAKTMNAGYEQITYKWNDGQFKYEVRWHTRTPGAPVEQGNTWVVQRTVPGNGGNKPQTFFKIGDNEWVEGYKWYDAINARKAGNATPEQIKILDKGHWKE
ncbi:T7SS effector LXG polymorphic toxin [Candidatus Enterococcus lemimoniae]|uniref:LXG domain-containing protein n=2 Tax=Enterococcus TaxID=1350 RepID=A0ABZ2T5P0_9ENTE|nr:T7SS effector LXG polymorphic toxin [Enterococcus sp. 12C11_DIV0727]OTO68567.1 hypothetical protein A5866_000765 [Enterococcus sp. 12C11_DIV0727]